MSQLPPCSRGGTVRAPSALILALTSPLARPAWVVAAKGGLASGGTRVGLVAISAFSRSFHIDSIFGSGRQPIKPGCTRPAKFTPGTWRDEVNMTLMPQVDFCASEKCSVRNPLPFFLEKKPL